MCPKEFCESVISGGEEDETLGAYMQPIAAALCSHPSSRAVIQRYALRLIENGHLTRIVARKLACLGKPWLHTAQNAQTAYGQCLARASKWTRRVGRAYILE